MRLNKRRLHIPPRLVCCLRYGRKDCGRPFRILYPALVCLVLNVQAAKRSSHYTIALEEIEACIAAPNTVEAEIEAKELARIIEAFLDTLTTENRVIFMRRYWFSDSYKDIAEFMGLSEKNISVRLTRIREKMKQYLIEREVFV